MFEFQAFSKLIFSSRARRTAALNIITSNWGSYIAGITSRGRGGLTLYSKHNNKIQTMSGQKIRMRGHNVIVLVRFGLDAQKLKIIVCISRLGLVYRLPSSNITNPTIQLDIIIPPTGNMGNRQWANQQAFENSTRRYNSWTWVYAACGSPRVNIQQLKAELDLPEKCVEPHEPLQSIAELKGPYTHLGARLAEKAKYRHEVGTGLASGPE